MALKVALSWYVERNSISLPISHQSEQRLWPLAALSLICDSHFGSTPHECQKSAASLKSINICCQLLGGRFTIDSTVSCVPTGGAVETVLYVSKSAVACTSRAEHAERGCVQGGAQLKIKPHDYRLLQWSLSKALRCAKMCTKSRNACNSPQI